MTFVILLVVGGKDEGLATSAGGPGERPGAGSLSLIIDGNANTELLAASAPMTEQKYTKRIIFHFQSLWPLLLFVVVFH